MIRGSQNEFSKKSPASPDPLFSKKKKSFAILGPMSAFQPFPGLGRWAFADSVVSSLGW